METTARASAARRRDRALVAIVASLAGFLGSADALYAARGFSVATSWVTHTEEVKVAIADLFTVVVDAETGQRGYLLTGQSSLREPYDRALARQPVVLEHLRALTSDNAVQQSNIAAADIEIRRKLDVLKEAIEKYDARHPDEAIAIVASGRGKAAMDALRADVATMVAEEDRLLEVRTDAARMHFRHTLFSIAFAVFAFVATAFLARAIRLETAAERRIAEAERLAMIERVRTAEFRQSFVWMLGHDLRNPLAAITTGLSVVRGKEPALGQIVVRMDRSARRMARMIDQLLDFTLLHLGDEIPLTKRSVDVAPIVEEAVDEARLAHPNRVIAVLAAPILVTCDSDRIEEIIGSLLENAVVHGDVGQPVRVECLERERTAVIDVSNAGTVDEASQARLFAPLERTPQMKTRASALGVGLYVAREIARAHGGDLELVREDAGRTTFRLSIPMDSPTLPQGAR